MGAKWGARVASGVYQAKRRLRDERDHEIFEGCVTYRGNAPCVLAFRPRPEPLPRATVDATPFPRKESQMDWNRVEGNWKQIKGKVKEKWGRLTDDDLDVIGGKRDQLEGKIQERYGQARDQVRKDIDDWYGTQKW
jgi:uncharacterized protein YjbJ (UPF0337 family)